MERKAIICLIIVVILVLVIVYLMSPSESYCNCTGMATAFNRAPYTFWRGAEWPTPYEARPGFSWSNGAGNALHTGRQWASNPGMPFLKSAGPGTEAAAYGLNEDAARDLYRDYMDGLIDTNVNYQPSSSAVASNQKAQQLAMENELARVAGTRYTGGGKCCACSNASTNLNAAPCMPPTALLAQQIDLASVNPQLPQLVPLSAIGASLPPGAVTNATPCAGSLATRLRYGDGEYLNQAPQGTYRYGGYASGYGAVEQCAPPQCNPGTIDLSVGVM